jgi:hypothetical protein
VISSRHAETATSPRAGELRPDRIPCAALGACTAAPGLRDHYRAARTRGKDGEDDLLGGQTPRRSLAVRRRRAVMSPEKQRQRPPVNPRCLPPLAHVARCGQTSRPFNRTTFVSSADQRARLGKPSDQRRCLPKFAGTCCRIQSWRAGSVPAEDPFTTQRYVRRMMSSRTEVLVRDAPRSMVAMTRWYRSAVLVPRAALARSRAQRSDSP